MATVGQLLRAEVSRAVGRDLRARGVDGALKDLKRRLAQLERRVSALEKKRPAVPVSAGRKRAVDGRTLRFSPSTLKKLRKRLGVTQGELAKLLNVSGNAVWQWEAGRAKPRHRHLAAVRELARIGKREARKRLEGS